MVQPIIAWKLFIPIPDYTQMMISSISDFCSWTTHISGKKKHLFSLQRSDGKHAAFSARLIATVSAKLHYTDTGYKSTNGRAHNNFTTSCTTNLPHRNARAQHLDMSRCWDVANFCPLVVNCFTTSCRIVVSLSVGAVVQHVRVVEFGTKQPRADWVWEPINHGAVSHRTAAFHYSCVILQTRSARADVYIKGSQRTGLTLPPPRLHKLVEIGYDTMQ